MPGLITLGQSKENDCLYSNIRMTPNGHWDILYCFLWLSVGSGQDSFDYGTTAFPRTLFLACPTYMTSSANTACLFTAGMLAIRPESQSFCSLTVCYLQLFVALFFRQIASAFQPIIPPKPRWLDKLFTNLVQDSEMSSFPSSESELPLLSTTCRSAAFPPSRFHFSSFSSSQRHKADYIISPHISERQNRLILS